MTFTDVAFLLGPVAAPFIGVAVVVALVVARPTRWGLWLGIVVYGLTALAWVTYWVLWGMSFERVDAGLAARSWVATGMSSAVWACAVGSVVLVLTAVSSFGSARRTRTAAA